MWDPISTRREEKWAEEVRGKVTWCEAHGSGSCLGTASCRVRKNSPEIAGGRGGGGNRQNTGNRGWEFLGLTENSKTEGGCRGCSPRLWISEEKQAGPLLRVTPNGNKGTSPHLLHHGLSQEVIWHLVCFLLCGIPRLLEGIKEGNFLLWKMTQQTPNPKRK